MGNNVLTDCQDKANSELGYNALNEYKKAVDASTIFSIADLQGRILYANRQFREVSGYSLEELLGKPHSIVRHPDMPSSAFKQMWGTIQSKQIWQGIVKNRKKNGDPYYVDATIVPILDEKGEIYEYAGIRKDITELVLKTEELAALKDKQRALDVQKALRLKTSEIVSSIPFPSVYIEGEENGIKEYNSAFANLFKESSFLDENCSLNDLLVQDERYISAGSLPLFYIYELSQGERVVAFKNHEGNIHEFFIGMAPKNDGYIVSFQCKGICDVSL